jgi:hypothetical protein
MFDDEDENEDDDRHHTFLEGKMAKHEEESFGADHRCHPQAEPEPTAIPSSLL